MARKNNSEELIHCNVCGEDYSATYRRCPFCGERMDVRPVVEDEEYEDDYVFDGQALFDDDPQADQAAPNKGGKRLAAGGSASGGKSSKHASSQKGGRYDPTGPVNWVRIITFGISLVVIIAALIIVFTVFYPMLHTGDNPSNSPSSSPSASQPVDPSPSVDPTGQPTDPVEPSPSPSPSDEPGTGIAAYITGASGGLNVRSGPGTTYDKVASLKNGDQVTIMEVLDNGWYKITYSGANGQDAIGYVKSDYVAASENSPAPSPEPSQGPGTSTGELVPGANGKIVGADGGLRVRSGPGTTYEHQASLKNGDSVTIVEDAGSGWYKISYAGSDGKATTGYIMGDYISVN